MQINSKYISSSALYSFTIWLTLVIFFQFWRLILFIGLGELTHEIPISIILKSFVVGFRFDSVIASYMTVLLYLLSVLPGIDVVKNNIMRRINLTLLFISTSIIFFIHLSDIEFYKFYHSRLNGMALQWTEDHEFVISMIWETYHVVFYLLLYLAMLSLFIWVVLRLVKWLKRSITPSPIWVNLIYFPIVILLLVIGGRGRIEEKAPLTWGGAYFSEYDTANQLALNPTFTFLRDILYDAGSKKETEALMKQIAIPEADSLLTELLGFKIGSSKIHREVNFDTDNTNLPNVIIIIMESFGASRIGCLDNKFPYELSPNFDSLAEYGTLFTNFYSSGSHTYSGIFCTLYGYPLIFGKSVMKQFSGQNKFYGLPSIFSDKGYETIFFTTHDPQFDNMQGFLMSNGFKRINSLFDYDSSEKISTLGVPDHVMFDQAVRELKKIKKPYFATLLSASNHGPWIVPDMDYNPYPDTVEDAERLNAFKYADWSLGLFIRNIAGDPDFTNTIVVITADNGMPYKSQLDLDLTQYSSPLLILQTDSMGNKKGYTNNMLGGQIDILPTVMGLTGLNYDDYSFGKNLLDTTAKGVCFAQFSDWYMVGYIEDNYYSISRINGPVSLHKISDSVSIAENISDSLNELSLSMSKKGLSILQKAYFNMLAPTKEN
ncbi:MAG: sulfatase-like hydrolase/transferase [bacterium]